LYLEPSLPPENVSAGNLVRNKSGLRHLIRCQSCAIFDGFPVHKCLPICVLAEVGAGCSVGDKMAVC